MTEFFRQFIDASMQHMAPSAAWMPYTGMFALAAIGLILLFKGAKLARLMSAVFFAGIGAIAAFFVAHGLGIQVSPALAVGGIIGLLLGVGLFRFWLSLLIAGFFVAGGVMLYGNQVLAPHIATLNDVQVVTLPAPAVEQPLGQRPQDLLAALWAHLAARVPNFQASLLTIVAATAVCGLLCGLLLPKMARALFAATAGAVCLISGGAALLQVFTPEVAREMEKLGAWLNAGAAILWALSLYWNLRDMAERKPAKVAEEPEPAPAAA